MAAPHEDPAEWVSACLNLQSKLPPDGWPAVSPAHWKAALGKFARVEPQRRSSTYDSASTIRAIKRDLDRVDAECVDFEAAYKGQARGNGRWGRRRRRAARRRAAL